MADPENTLEPGRLWVNDDRTSVIVREPDGSTSFYNEREDRTWRKNTSPASGGKDPETEH